MSQKAPSRSCHHSSLRVYAGMQAVAQRYTSIPHSCFMGVQSSWVLLAGRCMILPCCCLRHEQVLFSTACARHAHLVTVTVCSASSCGISRRASSAKYAPEPGAWPPLNLQDVRMVVRCL